MSVDTTFDPTISTMAKRALEQKSSSTTVSSMDFLKLLIAQLTNQDPLNPTQDMDFTGQLAQLQALEEQMAMTKSINAMRIDSQIQSGNAMIGKEITGVDKDGESVSGVVTKVVQTSDGVFVELGDGTQVPVGNVTNIVGGENSVGSDLANSSNAIGMWIEAGYDKNMQPIQGIVENVSVVDGKVVLQLYGGKSVTWNQVSKMRAPTDDEVWYTLPDELREKVENAQTMLNLTVTGVNEKGEEVTGIVADAELKGGKVYLVLYDGTRINVDDISKDPVMPTAKDAERDLVGLYAVGFDENGKAIEGEIIGAEDREDGLVLLLAGDKHVYYDSLSAITEVPEEK